ncbi:GFA family protein [Octadecabacter ascidiaceicola]|uniref:Glutathione-dependent formaldehyde-activating enzyme n=1 Tax=Octadecabacter ascidiaceicola TaxID=1655543 RepID=A0A238K5U2_9RHOB|nr:GFA family protein [Octadecabacter ascidiaceicola]SMX38278.1 Glutathione-dependent formaldehyde-activating enzyme [Octadecabacter ascidiaceicola]
MTIRGGCLCNGIQFALQGELKDVGMCHCSQCRRASGTAFAAYTRVSLDGFKWTSGEDMTAKFQTSPGVYRPFCGRCGSPLGAVVGDGNKLDWVALGAVVGDPIVRPEAHIFAGSKAPWHEITDDLPLFEDWPPTTSEFHGRFN